MNYELKRLNIWSVAKVSFVLGGVLGFLAGILLWMFADMLASLPLADLGDVEGTESLSTLGAVLPFMLAVFYGVAGMVFNAVMAGVYNVLAGMVGGVECVLVAAPQPYVAAPPQPPAFQVQPPPPPPPAQGPYGTTP